MSDRRFASSRLMAGSVIGSQPPEPVRPHRWVLGNDHDGRSHAVPDDQRHELPLPTGADREIHPGPLLDADVDPDLTPGEALDPGIDVREADREALLGSSRGGPVALDDRLLLDVPRIVEQRMETLPRGSSVQWLSQVTLGLITFQAGSCAAALAGSASSAAMAIANVRGLMPRTSPECGSCHMSVFPLSCFGVPPMRAPYGNRCPLTQCCGELR